MAWLCESLTLDPEIRLLNMLGALEAQWQASAHFSLQITFVPVLGNSTSGLQVGGYLL